MREYLIKETDSATYVAFLDSLNDCPSDLDMPDLLASTLLECFFRDIVKGEQIEEGSTLDDKWQSIETLNRISFSLNPELFNRQFPVSFRYSLLNIHPETL